MADFLNSKSAIQVDRLQIPESSESIFRRVASFDTRIARHEGEPFFSFGSLNAQFLETKIGEDPPPSSSEPDDTSSRPSSPPSPSTSDTGERLDLLKSKEIAADPPPQRYSWTPVPRF